MKKENEFLLFAITQMNLEDITLSEIRQAEKDNCLHLYAESKKVKLIETESTETVATG